MKKRQRNTRKLKPGEVGSGGRMLEATCANPACRKPIYNTNSKRVKQSIWTYCSKKCSESK